MATNDQRQMRLAASVIIVTYVAWLTLSTLGGKFGWNGRIGLLIDLGALAAFLWAMLLLFRVWRRRHNQ